MLARRWIQISASLLIVVAITWAAHSTHRSAAESPTLAQWQYQQVLNTQLKDPEIRAVYELNQRFLPLYNSVPDFSAASFGPTIRVVSWRSVKWVIGQIYEAPNGKQFAHLSYGAGPGVDEDYTAQLVDGRYVGRVNMDWEMIARDPSYRQGFAGDNYLPRVCSDVRGRSSKYAAIATVRGGPNITADALSQATMGFSRVQGTVLVCHRFGGLWLVNFGTPTHGVLFRLDGQRLVPVVRGYIRFANPTGRFLVIHIDAGYNDQDLQVGDYLEASPTQLPGQTR